jgi:hypothetical protein
MTTSSIHSPFPFFNMTQNFDGELASPGKRHAKPTTAIGTPAPLFADLDNLKVVKVFS